MKNFLRSPLCASGLIILVALVLYGRVLSFDYIWDDTKIFSYIADLLEKEVDWHSFARPMMHDLPYFRPLVVFSFYLDARIAGNDPGFSHGVNLVFFILNALLVFSIGRQVAKKKGRESPVFLALFAALLYVVHPAMMETAAWVSGRFDLMAAFFALCAMRIYLGGGKPLARIALVSLSLFLSLLCKETGAMFLLAMPCLWMATRIPSGAENRWQVCSLAWRENRGFFLGILAILALYLLLVTNNGNTGGYAEYITGEARHSRLFLLWSSLKFYLAQVFFPVFMTGTLHPIEESVFWGIPDVALLLLAWICLRKPSSSFWLLMAGLAYLLPVLHLVPLHIAGSLTQDRFLTVPLALWAVALSLVRYDFSSSFWKRLLASTRFLPRHLLGGLAGLAGIWILSMALTTYFIVPLWKNDLLFWSWNYSMHPDNHYGRRQYFASAISVGHPDLVEKEVLRILEKSGTLGMEIQHDYGVALLASKDPRALDWLKDLIERVPDFHIHERPDSLEKRNEMLVMTSNVIASAYSHYAQAILYYERNPQKALEMNEIGQWYADADFYASTEVRYGKYWQIAYLYALGEFEKADARFSLLPSSRKQEARGTIRATLSYHCRDAAPEYCGEIRARGLANPS
jgi:hypothetical protein